MSLQKARELFPNESHLSDEELGDKIYKEHYSDLPREEFNKKFFGEKKQEKINRPSYGPESGRTNPVEPFLANVLDAAANAVPSTLNLIPGAHFPYSDVSSLLSKEQQQQQIPKIAGKIAGLAGPGGLAVKGLSAIPRAAHIPKLVAEMAKYGAAGFATGAESDDDLIGRSITALLGAGAPAAGYGAKLAGKTIAGKYHSPNIAKEVLETKRNVQNLFRKKYNDFFESAKEQGINKVFKPKEVKEIGEKFIKRLPQDKTEKLKEFMSSPTLKNAHSAQSELEKVISGYKSKRELLPHEETRLKAAEKLRKSINGSIDDVLNISGNKKLADEYKSLGKDYAQEYVPYASSNAIKGLTSRKLKTSKKDFARKLASEPDFMEKVGKNHPELVEREHAKNAALIPLIQKILGMHK